MNRMKRVFRTVIFTSIITLLCMCYIYLMANPFRERKIEVNIAEAQQVRTSLSALEDRIDERQSVYDRLYEICEELSE